MKLKKLDLDNFDSQLRSYSPKAIRQQLNCLAANVNRLVDAVNDISEPAEEPIKDEPTKPDLVRCRDCCFYNWNRKIHYDHLYHWCNKNEDWCGDDNYCGDGVSKKIFEEREEEIEETTIDAVNDISEPVEEHETKQSFRPSFFTLKPCPFCGGEADLDDLGYPRVRCTKCGASSDPVIVGADKIQIAIDDWNTRCEEVVTCRDCVFYGWSAVSKYTPDSHWCNKNGGWHTDDFYCKDGFKEKGI